MVVCTESRNIDFQGPVFFKKALWIDYDRSHNPFSSGEFQWFLP